MRLRRLTSSVASRLREPGQIRGCSSGSTLTAVERERGWVEYHCDAHGFLVATTPRASVFCACGKRARRLRNGRIVDRETLKPTQAKARDLNAAGHPRVHACGDCGADFHGETLLKRHRVGGKLNKRCLAPSEMTAKGWALDGKGRWRDRRNNDRLGALATTQVSEARRAESAPPSDTRGSGAA